MEVSAENDRFSSNDLVVSIEVAGLQASKDDASVFFLHSKTEPSHGHLIVDKNKTSAGGNGVVIVGAVLLVTVAVVAAGFMARRMARFVIAN